MRPGDTFGDYTVLRRLGKGGMGEVWLLEGKSGLQIAAKILEASADHDARKRFLREAELALGVRHPNLVETYDVGEDPETGLCYILMEYVPGGTLADRIRKDGALAIADAVKVVSSIANVLELGRRKGIVHRDIKPANIMFDAEGTPKLADLGIARRGLGADTTTVTQTGVMIGTPAYMSPEQMFDSHRVDTRADIYSLGVVFFEMLTGQRPNRDDTVVQLMARAMKGEPLPDVRTLRPEVSASLAQLLNMMVAPDVEERIPTPGQITTAIAVIERGGELVPTSHGAWVVGSVLEADRRRRRRRTLWRALAVVGLLAAICLTILKFHLAEGVMELVNSRCWSRSHFGQKVSRMTVIPENERMGEPPDVPVKAVRRPIRRTDVLAKAAEQANADSASAVTAIVDAVAETVARTNAETVAPTVAPTNAETVARTNAEMIARSGERTAIAVPAITVTNVPSAKTVKEALLRPLPPPTPVLKERVRECPSPKVPVHSPKPPEKIRECEFVPYFRGWTGNARYPERIDSFELKGCAAAEVRKVKNGRGGESVVLSFRGKNRTICFLTIAAEGKTKTVSVQLNPQMPENIEVNLSE